MVTMGREEQAVQTTTKAAIEADPKVINMALTQDRAVQTK